MYICLERSTEGLIRSRRDETKGESQRRERKLERMGGMRGNRYTERARGFTRSRESKFMRRAGTDISQKMNHPYTSGPTHRGNSGTIVRQ